MPNDIYNGPDAPTYRDMACHCFALSANRGQIDSINTRYTLIGDYLSGRAVPPEGTLRERLSDMDYTPGSVMLLLRDEFGFAPGRDTDIRIWGFFRDDNQRLPEHMWFTRGERIFDTMPGHPIRKDVTIGGNNPPSETHVLPAGRCFSVEVAALYIDQLKFYNSAAWQVEV